MELNLKNKSALVCGSTQGIGRATAIALANEGARITLIARNEQKLKHANFASMSPNAWAHQLAI